MPTPLEVVREIYAAMAARDVEGVLARCHPDVVITQDPALPWGGRYVGADGVAEFAINLVGAIDSAVTPIAMFEAENDVVQYGHTAGTARESGKQFNIPECHVWTVVDGKVTNARFYIDSAAMLDALAP
jgi:ketosteroid isomerase-like protein